MARTNFYTHQTSGAFVGMCACDRTHQMEKTATRYKKQQKATQKVCERYQNLSEEEKEEIQKCSREKYRNISKSENQKLIEYRKIITKHLIVFHVSLIY